MGVERAKRVVVAGYAVSGACALIYQVVWSHALVDQLGASSTTLLVVLCAFIGGLGLGSVISAPVYRAVASRIGGHGLRNYGRTELALTLATLVLFGLTKVSLAPVIGRFPYRPRVAEGLTLLEPTVAYQAWKLALAVVAVGLPCVLMGLTFPYLCSLFAGDATFPSRLYASNTFGACTAAVVTEFWGLGALGYVGCLAVGALGTTALGLYFLRWPEAAGEGAPATAGDATGDGSPAAPVSLLPGLLSGVLCGGIQALGLAYIRLELGPTRGAFALLSAFAILGIWLASTFVHRYRPSRAVLLSLAWGGLVWTALVWGLEPELSRRVLLAGARSLPWLTPYAAAFVAVATALGIFLFVPYAAWSTLLPSLCDRLQERGLGVAWAYGLNTLSFLAGVLLFGWVLPGVHVFYSARVFALVAAVGLALLTASPWDRPLARGRVLVAGAALAGGLLLVPRGVPERLFRYLSHGTYRLLAYRGTAQSFFWVRANPDGSRSLMFDGHSMSGSTRAGQTYMRVMAHLPLLLHPEPRRALLICFGVGVTADAIRQHRPITNLDIVDLNPDVYLLNRHFRADNGNVLGDPRVRLFCDDGRQFVKLVDATYDLVTMEPPPPPQPGIARLYSAEYYAAVRRRLAPGGVVSQWLPESQMDATGVDLVIATFVKSFRYSLLTVGFGRELILVGSDRPLDLVGAAVRLKAEPEVQKDLARFGVTSTARLLAMVLRMPGSLQRDWGQAPVIEDGFASLEALHVNSSVQEMHPRSAFVGFKPELRVERGEVPAALRASGTGLDAEVARLQANPEGDAAFDAIVPPWYFPR